MSQENMSGSGLSSLIRAMCVWLQVVSGFTCLPEEITLRTST
jgi:hypothetical protein